MSVIPGWYDDPEWAGYLRWWTGRDWSVHRLFVGYRTPVRRRVRTGLGVLRATVGTFEWIAWFFYVFVWAATFGFFGTARAPYRRRRWY